MRILVLGGYGLIGTQVVRHLRDCGHSVIGLGRDISGPQRQYPDVTWIAADISKLDSPAAWQPILSEAAATVVVNCAGALQDGARDDVHEVQSTAMRALFGAASAQGIAQFVQISATRADTGSDTVFMRSKGEADTALRASALDWVILRPGLVIAPQAYGGTALLRALSACPLVQPLAFGGSQLQTVAVEDVARAVGAVVNRQVATRRIYDLVEDQPHTLADILHQLRAWHGLPPAREIGVPRALITVLAWFADGLGWLGWRSPLRTTATVELAAGVLGDPTPWREQTGTSLASLEATLRQRPSTVQDRWFARAFFVKPMAIAVLALFWIVTGVLTFADTAAAAHVLSTRGFSASTAHTCVITGAALDVMLGCIIARRASVRLAAFGMIAVTLVYLVGAAVLTPDLWTDPLGPMVKAVPAMMLALVVLAFEGDR